MQSLKFNKVNLQRKRNYCDKIFTRGSKGVTTHLVCNIDYGFLNFIITLVKAPMPRTGSYIIVCRAVEENERKLTKIMLFYLEVFVTKYIGRR